MRISGNYEKIIEDNLKEELEWLEEELSILFKDSKDYSKNDIILANYIMDKIVDNVKSNNSEEVLNKLAITLNRIEQTYPAFF